MSERVGRYSRIPWEELKVRARIQHALDPDELVGEKDLYLELLDEVLALWVVPTENPPLAIEWLFASMITMDLWRAHRAVGGVRQRVQELETRDASEARRRAFADVEERRRLRDAAVDAALKALLHLDEFRQRRFKEDDGVEVPLEMPRLASVR